MHHARRWAARISAVRAGSRAYAKVLHSQPWQGSAWGDCATAALAEHTLRRADDSGTPAEREALRAHAARLLRGAMFLRHLCVALPQQV